MKHRFSWAKVMWMILVLTLPAVIIHHFFEKIIACPSCYLFEEGGDGLKNYFTLDYYVKHDSGWHFSGMNYPYGEHIIYTDNQPILAMTLRWVDQHIVDMDGHVIGTMNMLLLISIYLACLITYVLLRRWEMGRWWALGAALCITFLSPQLWRLHGHYALGYVFFIPLMILLLDFLVRSKKRRWVWAICLGLLTVMTSLTHMYFLFFSSFVIASFTFFWWVYNRKEKALIRQMLPLLLGALILPGLFLVGLRKWTDPIQDRPTEPYGLENHTIEFESTFFSFIPPFDKTWSTVLKYEKPINERAAYVGIIGFLLLPGALLFLLRRSGQSPMDHHLKIFLWVAVITWGMAAGLIYQNGFKFLWEAVPVLKQFRGMGRFGIPFYYLYTLVCAYLLWHAYKRIHEKDLGPTGTYLLGCIFLVWGFEAWCNLKAISAPVFHPNETLNASKEDYVPLLKNAGYTPDDFQAILQLPIVVIGNENMGVTRGFWTLREATHASTETGIPMIGYAMSRTSIAQGMDLLELISTPYTPKHRASHFNDKPILLLCEEEFVLPGERQWIDQATKIGMYKSITLYAISASKFKKAAPSEINDTTLVYSSREKFFNGFEDQLCDTVMSGQGALPITSSETLIWSYTDTASVPRTWKISFWSHVDNRKGATPVSRVRETDPSGIVTYNQGRYRDHIEWAEAYQDWIQVSFPLTTLGAGYTYELFIDNAGPVIDNLLIYQEGDTCLQVYPDMLLYNNLPIPKTE